MRIDNVRFGFACNSSSTHSLILMPQQFKPKRDQQVKKDNVYGWNYFILTSKRAKLGYIGTLLKNSVDRGHCPQYIWDYYVREWLDGVDVHKNGYIDHASMIYAPTYFNSSAINKEFFDEFKASIMQKNVVIFGGNDDGHCWFDVKGKMKEPNAKLMAKGKRIAANQMAGKGHETARKDPKYGYWVLFNKQYGTKLRLSFDDCDTSMSSLPELVDLKITDYCDEGCSFCYQNSSEKGKHADLYKVINILEALAELQVPEVALGGGECTEHPYFHTILKEAKSKGIVPNFTTKNYDWFRDEKNRKVFNECCGRVAFSVHHRWDIDKVMSIIRYHNLRREAWCLQIVDKVCDVKDLVEHSCEAPITLLGYKACGRGATERFTESQKKMWKKNTFDKVIKNVYCGEIGVDTKYLLDHRKEIEKANIPRLLLTPKEGQYSMYIDAVKKTMAESSYTGEPVPLESYDYDEKETKGYAVQIQRFFEKCSADAAKR